MSESFYTSAAATASPPLPSTTDPTVAAAGVAAPPPPPPPKPLGHARTDSADPSRSGTPAGASTPAALTNSPRPQPPIPSQTPQQAPPPANPQPRIPPPALEERWLPAQLQEKPLADLTPLLQDAPMLAHLAAQHQSYASSLQPLDAAVAANVALAGQVAALETQLRKLRDDTAQLLLNHTSLQTQWRRKQSEMDDAISPWGPRAMYQRLVSSINEQEALLRAIQESFLEGTGDESAYYGGGDGKASEKEVTDWLRRIREGATALEKRKEMRARWDEGRVGGWR